MWCAVLRWVLLGDNLNIAAAGCSKEGMRRACEGVDSFCNPANSNYTTKPLPCTQQQEADALAQLAEDSASPGDFAVLADNSTCNATDAYSEPVDLMDPDLLEVGSAAAAAVSCR